MCALGIDKSIHQIRYTIQINNEVIQRVQYSKKLLIENCGGCSRRSGGWRVSRRRGRIFFYLAAYMLVLVCHVALPVTCTNLLFFGPFRIFLRSHPGRGLVFFVSTVLVRINTCGGGCAKIFYSNKISLRDIIFPRLAFLCLLGCHANLAASQMDTQKRDS